MNSGAAWLSFASPTWLYALAAVLAPIAAHLWSRRLGPPRLFPAVRLMLEAQRHTSRATRPNDLLLLVMRCLAVGLIALAFAQPLTHRWQVVEAGVIVDEADVDRGLRVAVVIDASASMSRVVAGRSLFEESIDDAVDMIARSDDRIAWAVIIAGPRPRPLLPEPTRATDALIERLKREQVTGGHAPLAEAYRVAVSMLAGRDEPAARPEASPEASGDVSDGADAAADRALHVWTDAQATSLRGAAEGATLPPSVRFVRHIVGKSLDTTNMSIRSMTVSPDRPIAGRPAVVAAEVMNHTDRPREVVVRFTGITDAPARTLRLPPNGAATASFALRIDHLGNEIGAVVTAELPDDAFELDNRMSVALLSRPPIDVAMLTGEAIDTPDNPAFYLARAIAPHERPGFAVRQLDADMIAADATERPEVLVTLAPPRLSDDQRDTIAAWARAGTGVIAIGRSPLPSADMLIDDRSPIDNEAAGPPEDVTAASLVPLDVARSPWRVFEGEALATLRAVAFAQPLHGRLTPGSTMLARWPNGLPALAAAPLGRGRVLHWVAQLTADEPLFASPAFVPLVHELLAMVRPTTPTTTMAQPGDTVRQPLMPTGAPERVTLEGPDAGPLRPTVIRDATGRLVGQIALPNHPSRIGFYRWLADDEQLLAGTSVRLDPRESDLRPGAIARPGVRRDDVLPPGDNADFAPAPTAATPDQTEAGAAATAPVGRWLAEPLWHWFIGAAAIVLLTELIVGRWLSRSDPVAVPIASPHATAEPARSRSSVAASRRDAA